MKSLRAMEVVPDVFRFRDTCNVYVLRSDREATLIDFGSGAVLDHLAELDVDRVADVLVTHHHRDQVQGLARAEAAGARIWAPPVERDLIAAVDLHWLRRPIENDYDLRQDRFSLLEPVPIAGTAAEYRVRRYGRFDVFTLPTPGHTIGSVTYLVEHEGRRLAFTGDLLYGDGKVWSLAATQWTYSGVEGQIATYLSLGVLAERRPDLVLPSHGEPIEDPTAAIELTQRRFDELIAMRSLEPWDLEMRLRAPWGELSPHLLRNRASMATGYALLSDSGSALLIDFGYDLWPGHPPPADRSSRRPLLGSIGALRRDYGVERVEVVVPTHYHDDHIAGINLLREVEGTELWSPENVAPVLEDPRRYDLPCLWYDPVPADRLLAPGMPFGWREYELTAHPLPGHTLYAAAVAVDVDGRRVVATGDQQTFEADGRSLLNYQYRNRFRIDDYVRSAELYLSLRPNLMIGGHWPPHEVSEEYLRQLHAEGLRLAALHRELLPLADVDFGAEGFGARIEPYRLTLRSGEALDVDVKIRNPFDRQEVAAVRLVVPEGWSVAPARHEVLLDGRADSSLRFQVRADDVAPVRRARLAADLSVGDVPFGQQAEALVDVE
jgi:glyoxylase-like metal-dependent hydrolase (beta-lactamase superfamily II)